MEKSFLLRAKDDIDKIIYGDGKSEFHKARIKLAVDCAGADKEQYDDAIQDQFQDDQRQGKGEMLDLDGKPLSDFEPNARENTLYDY